MIKPRSSPNVVLKQKRIHIMGDMYRCIIMYKVDQIMTFTDDDTAFGILDMNHDDNILAIGCNKTIKMYELSYVSEWE